MELYAAAVNYLYLLLIVVTALIPDFALNYTMNNYFPNDVTLLRQESLISKTAAEGGEQQE